MAGTGGFSFGAKTTASTPGGLTFGTPAASTPAAGGFSFGGTPAASTPAAGGFSFGGTAAQTKPATTGLTFGTPGATATAPTLGFGGTPGAATTSTASVGFGTGITGLSCLAAKATTATPATGVGFGIQATQSTASATPAFGFAKPLPATGSTLGTATTGFNLAKPLTTTAATGFGLGGATTSTTGLGGFGTTGLGGAPAATGSIFGTTPAKTTSSGLGGLDPKTTTTTAGTTSDGAKASDGKTVKETPVEKEVLLDVDRLTKFVKEEKAEMEHIKRMSSTPMIKVQEDNAALRQLLSVVSSGLQRNVCNVDKLKREMTQELKNAEMAIRTKEIPPGLQYENMAPTQYFQSLVENFESQMLCYRQQIEMLENHLSSLHTPNRLTAEELVLLLRKLHEAFVAMAAQLQQVHEAVKTQKEHYLNYRKVFLGDSRNIFERQKKAPVRATPIHHTEPYGQAPFPGVNNAAAVAMATALTRSQQPQPQPGAAQTFRPFDTTGGATGLGATAGQAGFKGLFATPSTLQTGQPGSLFSSAAPAVGVQPVSNLSTATEQPFQLNKPPLGSKRGKRF